MGLPAEETKALLDDAAIRLLGERGWLVLDGPLGAGTASAARAEALALREGGALSPAGVGHRARHLLARRVRGDSTCWLDAGRAVTGLLAVLALFERLRGEANAGAFLGLCGASVQLACYPGRGERYLPHVDTFHDGSAARRLTAVYYLNPGWSPEHGGCLRLHGGAGAPTDVEPFLDRLLLLLSSRVEHEVLPAWAERWAVSAFFHGPQPLPGG